MRAITVPQFGPPVAPPGYTVPIRRYDRRFDYGYASTIAPVPPPGANLIPVMWDGLALNAGDDPVSGLFIIIENADGWLASPPVDGHDTARALSDGSAWGPKVLGARVITLTGVALGDDADLAAFRDQLAMRAANRQPADLTITDAAGRSLTASCRCDTGLLQHTFIGLGAFRYQVVLTAADPLLYDPDWQQVSLSPAQSANTGRTYQRTYGWQYAAQSIGNAADLTNDGNADAVAYLLFTGDLASPEISDDGGNQINLSDIGAGMTILLESDTLAAVGPGGLSRASYVQAGSLPMVIPAQSSATWHLYASGSGYVTIQWRSAWS
jgi:hypothetical protein